MKYIFWFFALFWAPSAWAQSDAQNVMAAITGVKLIDPQNHVYSATSDNANYSVFQFSSPEYLPPFNQNQSENEYTRVSYNPDGSLTLEQHGKNLPCMKIYKGSGKNLVEESDLLASSPRPRWQPPLSTLAHVYTRGVVRAQGLGVYNNQCKPTVGVVGTSVVLGNSQTHDVFFYQLKFGSFRDDGQPTRNMAQPAWFATGTSIQTAQKHTYGRDEQIWDSQYGMKPLAFNKETPFNLDILPSLKADIAMGAKFGMDQDLSHWVINGSNFGSSQFGDVGVRSTWSHLELIEESLK